MYKDVAEIMRANRRTIPQWSLLEPLGKTRANRHWPSSRRFSEPLTERAPMAEQPQI
jgi:hypothetical protein